MAIKDIFVILSAEALNAARLTTAARLARAHGAAITGLCLYRPPPFSMADSFAVGAAADLDVLDRAQARAEAHVAPVHRDFIRATKGLEAVWAAPVDEPAEDTALRARLYDLTVVGALSGGSPTLIEQLVLESGAPCLIVPEDRPAPLAFDKVVVAWNGSRQARRALADAMPILERAVHVQVVAAEESARDLGPAALEAVAAHLARHGITAEPLWLDGRSETAAEALDRHVAQSGADLLVMGAYSHPRAAEVILGGVTSYFLGDPPLAILASR